MILPAQESVLVQFFRDVDLVAGRAEFRGVMKWFEICFLVEVWFCFDHLTVDEGEKWRFTHGKGVQVRLADEELRISSGARNRFDGVTDGAGDSRL